MLINILCGVIGFLIGVILGLLYLTKAMHEVILASEIKQEKKDEN